MDELTDGALISNSERHGGKIVLDSGTYARHQTESPAQFLASVRANHNAWISRKEAEESRKARDAARAAEQENAATAGSSVSGSIGDVQEVEVSLEDYLESKIARLLARRNTVGQQYYELAQKLSELDEQIGQATNARKAIKQDEPSSQETS